MSKTQPEALLNRDGFQTAFLYGCPILSRTFAYARVSTPQQDPDNQLREIAAAGFHVDPHRLVTETISGSTAVAQRLGFAQLLNKMEGGDVLIVTKLDRLGRNAIDVSQTVTILADRGISGHPGALPGARRRRSHQSRRSDDDDCDQRRRPVRAGSAGGAHPIGSGPRPGKGSPYRN